MQVHSIFEYAHTIYLNIEYTGTQYLFECTGTQYLYLFEYTSTQCLFECTGIHYGSCKTLPSLFSRHGKQSHDQVNSDNCVDLDGEINDGLIEDIVEEESREEE